MSNPVALSLHNQYIAKWLDMVGETEAPDIFHIWVALATISGALARRVEYHHSDTMTIHPNMYIMLVGDPATKKSTAADVGFSFLSKCEEIVFGPKDTGGKKQGIISAFSRMENKILHDLAEELGVELPQPKKVTESEEAVEYGLDALADILNEADHPAKPAAPADPMAKFLSSLDSKPDLEKPTHKFSLEFWDELNDKEKWDLIRTLDHKPRHMTIFADEFTNLFGQNQMELVTFLTEIYNNRHEYEYSLARTVSRIPKPSLTMLVCGTTSAINSHLPPSSIGQEGQGFSTRMMFVYSKPTGKKIYKPAPQDKASKAYIASRTSFAASMEGEMTMDASADKLSENLYLNYTSPLTDSRFLGYFQRRQGHMFKVAMCLAAGEGRRNISAKDIADAHALLVYTERGFTDALGNAGKEPVTKVKENIVALLEAALPNGIPFAAIQRNAVRDIPKTDFIILIQEMIKSGEVRRTKLPAPDKKSEIDMLIGKVAEARPNARRVSASVILSEYL